MFDKEIYRFVYFGSKLECNGNRRCGVPSLQCLFQHILRIDSAVRGYAVIFSPKLLILAFAGNVLQFFS